MESPTASTSRLGSCASKSCARSALYKCPACSFPSCSLACSSSHKLTFSCTGIAPPVWSKHIKASEWGWGTLMRDQSYISSVGRLAEEKGKSIVGAGLIPRGRGGGESAGVLDDRSEKEDKLVGMARAAGVNMVLLPKGMSRRTRNSTRWDAKEQRMEWTTEVILQSRPAMSSPNLTFEPFTIQLSSIPSSQTLQQVLVMALDHRDKKGKGKASAEDELEWIKKERYWVDSQAPTSTTSASPSGDKSDDIAITPHSTVVDDSESPFLFLLAIHSIPTFSNPSAELDESETPLPSSIVPPNSTLPLPKLYYQPLLSSTLSGSLQGVTLLEYPTFEFWSRAAFSDLLSKGQVKILPMPAALEPMSVSSGSWDRGRGRGRGGGRGSSRGEGGRGRGRGSAGGRGGSHSGHSNGWKDELPEGERVQDSGWGTKRRIVEVQQEETEASLDMEPEDRESKKERLEEVEIEVEMVLNNGIDAGSGDLSLVDYNSD